MKKKLITMAIVFFLVIILPQLITYDQLFILGLASILGLLVYFMVSDYFKRNNNEITEIALTVTDNSSEELPQLQLIKMSFDEDYKKEWHIYNEDYLQLARNGVPVNDSIYRTFCS